MSTPELTEPATETKSTTEKPTISQLPLSYLKRNEETSGNTLLKDLLVKLDTKFEPLKGYFSSVNAVLDHHSRNLNEIQKHNKAQVMKHNYLEDIERLAVNSTLKDEDLNRMLSGLVGQVCTEIDEDGQNNPVNMMCNRLAIFVNGFSHFHRVNKELAQRLDKLENEMPKKMSDSFGKQKMKKQKRKLKEQIKTETEWLNARLTTLEEQLTERIDPVQEKLLEVEKQTLWRIRDCEDLLKTRVSGTYVDDQVLKIEQKLKSEMGKVTLGGTEEIMKALNGVISKIEESEKSGIEKHTQFKEKLRELEEFLAKKVEMSKLEEFQKTFSVRSDSTLEEVRTLTRRFEPAIEKVEKTLKNMVGNVDKNTSGLKDLSVLMENYMLSGGVRPKTTQQGDGEGDGSQMSGVQVVLGSYKEKIELLGDMMVKIQEGLNDKVSAGRFEAELMRRAERLETSHSHTDEVQVQIEDRSNAKVMRNIEELQQKLNRVETDVEMKLIKLKRELDVGNVGNITKALKAKADEVKVQKNFEGIEMKIESILETFHLLKKELDQSSAILQKISVQALKFGDKAQGSSKGLTAQACLSCSQSNFPMLSIQNAQVNERRRAKNETEIEGIIYEHLNTSDTKDYGYGYNVTTDLNGSMDSKLARRPPSQSRSLSRGSPNLGPRVRPLAKPNVLNLFNFTKGPSFVRSNSTFTQ